MGENQSPGNEAAGQASTSGSQPPRKISSADILQGDREVLIQHGTETYRLRVTKSNKLILNK